MEKFSNDPIENVAINALPDIWPKYRQRLITFNKTSLVYYLNQRKWSWEGTSRSPFEDVNWNDEKEEIIDFLCKAKPELEREFLRAKSELDLTKKTISAL